MNDRTIRRIAALSCVFTALTATGASAAPPFDVPWVGYDTAYWPNGLYPYDAVTGDFNGDGTPDLAAVCFLVGSPHFTVLMGDGAGGYLPPITYAMFLESAGVAALDWNNDGDLDLAISDTDRFFGGFTVSIWDNDGKGTFTHAEAIVTGDTGPAGIVAADFDDDGWIDLAVAHDSDTICNDSVSILRNLGGIFTLQQFVSIGGCPREIDAGDVDGDGRADLVIGHRSNQWSVLLNQASGGGPFNFAHQSPIPGIASGNLPANPTIHLSDIDLDGDLDVFYSHQDTGGGTGQGAIGLWRNQNAGPGIVSFAPPQILSFNFNNHGGVDVTTGDITGDGWPDVLTVCGPATGSNGFWFLFESDGAGGFSPPRKLRAGHRANSVHLSDIDVDGDLDATIIGAWSLEACVYLNPGDGQFVQPAAMEFCDPAISPAFTINVEAGDIDSDGDLDLVSGFRSDFSSSNGLTVRRNLGDGTFGPRETYAEPVYPVWVRLRDMDNDGDLDLLYFDANTMFCLRVNDGSGAFGPRLPKQQFSIAVQNNVIDAVDVDHDGDLDVCMNTGFFFRISRNLGNNNFGAPYVAANVSNHFTQTFAFGDFNEDGKIDLVTDAGSQVAAVLLCLGTGTGTFGSPIMVTTGERDVHSIGVADLDGDGHLDLTAICDRTPKTMTIRRGLGNGTFHPAQNHNTSFFFDQYTPGGTTAIVDADGDGELDILFANTMAQDFSFWRNNGDGTFAEQIRCGAGFDVYDLAAGDFNGDGLIDVAMSTQVDDGQWFYAGVVVIDGSSNNKPIPGDVNGDGSVNVADLLAVISSWGACAAPPAACPADVNDDGQVNVADLLLVISNWT